MFVAKLPGSMYATQATNAGPRKGRMRKLPRRSPRNTRPASYAVRAVAFIELSLARELGAPKLRHAQLRQVAVAFVQIEAVADEVLVRDNEAEVPDREIVDEPPVGTVEQRRDREGGRPTQREQLAQVVQRQAGVDHVLDDEHVAALDRPVQVLQQPHPLVPPRDGAVIAGELDEIEFVERRDRSREVGEEEQGAFERRDEQEVEAGVVGGDLGAHLADARLDLLGGEVGLADAKVVG